MPVGRIRVTGLFLAIAGAAIWGLSLREERARPGADAQRIFDALGNEDEESQQDASALIELSHATPAVRMAFLRAALKTEAASGKLRLHEQGISVAVSQVDSAEARTLYGEVLLPALKASPGPAVLRECFALLVRWSLVSQVSPGDAAGVASQLTARIAGENNIGETTSGEPDTASLELYSQAIATLAPRIRPESAAALAAKLFARATKQHDRGIMRAASRSLMEIAPRLSEASRREFSSALVAYLVTERNVAALIALAPALAPLSVDVDPKVAGELAASLATRMSGEWDPEALDALVSAFRAVAARADTLNAQRISTNLLQHVKLEPDPAVLLLMTQALAAFGDKLPHAVYEKAGGAILKRIQAERNAATLSVWAYSLGVLKDKAAADQFEEASKEIVSRFAAQHDLSTLSALAASIDSVADDLEAPVAERLSSALVARMIQEHDAGSMFYIALGLESIADEAKGPGAAALVAHLTGRLRQEHRSNMLRSLAFSVGAFQNAAGDFEAPAEVLVARMAEENEPDELRTLTSALYALRHKAGPRSFEKAASILAARIQTQLDPGAIRTLVANLHALAEKVGSEPFEQAASAIVANVNNLPALEPALKRIGPKLRLAKAQELGTVLAARVAREPDPKALRVLGQALADLPLGSLPLKLGPILAIPQAPCQASHSASQLLNPLCNENAWDELAASVVRVKKRSANDELEPDFAQLAPDDDDVAPAASDEEASLDFHQVSDALNGLRLSGQNPGGPAEVEWSGIALLISGLVILLYTARPRAGQRIGSKKA